jgi:cobalt-zinc-cadmium efflux system outer membrane protein
MAKFFLLFLSIIFFSFSAFSKDYTIEELINIAEQNSANIRRAQYLALAQKRLANQQKYWSNPVISVGRLGDQDIYDVSQTIPFYNKLQSKYDIEEAEFRVLEIRKSNLALFVKSEVFSLLYQYQALKKKIELAQKRLDRLTLVDQYLAKIVLSSSTKKAQWRITKDKISLVERDLIKYRNELFQTWNLTNIYLNLESEPTNIDFEWLDDSNFKGKNFFVNSAIENNLELKEQKILISKYKSELKFAKVEQMPDVTISATRQNSNSASLNANNKDATGVGLSLSVPLFNRNQEKIASFESKIKSQEFEIEFQKNQLIQLINNDISKYETSLKLAKIFPIANIKTIIFRLSEANSDFKKGVLDFITYIELDSQEYQIIDTILNNQVELAMSYAELMKKVGNFTIPTNDK